MQSNLHITVSSAVAAAVVWMSEYPSRLTPIILPLMASIKREQVLFIFMNISLMHMCMFVFGDFLQKSKYRDKYSIWHIYPILQEEILQMKSAEALAELMYQSVERRPCPNDKLIKNICGLTCMDPSETPQAEFIRSMDSIDDQGFMFFGNPGGKQRSKAQALAGEDRSKVEGFINRRGSELSLRFLCAKFGVLLFDKLPKLWDCLTEVLKPSFAESLAASEKEVALVIESVSNPQTLINNIQVCFFFLEKQFWVISSMLILI